MPFSRPICNQDLTRQKFGFPTSNLNVPVLGVIIQNPMRFCIYTKSKGLMPYNPIVLHLVSVLPQYFCDSFDNKTSLPFYLIVGIRFHRFSRLHKMMWHTFWIKLSYWSQSFQNLSSNTYIKHFDHLLDPRNTHIIY